MRRPAIPTVTGLVLLGLLAGEGTLAQQAERLDPAAWGADHVGQPLPEYVVGDECLFCHRGDVSQDWSDNPHERTMRAVDPDSEAWQGLGGEAALGDARIRMGDEVMARFLRRSERYGHYDLFSVGWRLGAGEPTGPPQEGEWLSDRFGERCAGCHATAVESETMAASSSALDCYTCHGAVDIQHANESAAMIFAKQRDDPPREVVSICGSCHIRTGRSRSTGRPYPNQFVPGDNLFRDFEVDWSDEALAKLDPADRHVLENVRAVAVEGRESITCLTCHSVHGDSAQRHESLRFSDSCSTCHLDPAAPSRLVEYEDHSDLCEY